MADLTGTPSPISTLVKLKGKLTLRQFTRERGRILGAIIVLVAFGPMVVGGTIGTAIGYRQLPDQWPTALLGGVLVVLWGIWLMFPILFSSINEGLDVTRLLMYPLSQRDLAIGTLLGTLFDYPTYLVLPLFAAMLWGFGLGPALPVVLIGLLISYGHMVLIGQIVMAILGGVLQSRRFRDVSIIIFSLLGSSCYFINLSVQRLAENLAAGVDEAQVLALQPLTLLQWFPTGAAARSIEQALVGAWGTAFLWLLYTAVLLVIFTWVWLWLLNRLSTGGGFLINAKPRAEKEEKRKRPSRFQRIPLLHILPDDIETLVIKELKSIWRIPQRRVGLIQGLVFPFIMGGAFIFSSDAVVTMPTWISLVLVPYALFIYWVMTQNMLAWEGRGLPTLLLTPIPRERIFWAKGIALLLVSSALYLVIGLLLVVVTRDWLAVAAVLTGVTLGGAVMAVTAVSSVIFPIRINLESKQMRSAVRPSGGGCLAGLGTTFVVPIAIGLVSLPAVVPLLAAWWFELPWLGFVGVLFSLAYGGVLFRFAAKFAGSLLLEREGEVLEALRAPDDASA